MRVLFAGKQHFSIGGVESDTDQLARHLLGAGHDVAVLAGPGAAQGRRTVPALERVAGYPYVAWAAHQLLPEEALQQARTECNPDVLVVNAASEWWHDWTRALVLASGPLPCVLYIRDRQSLELLDELSPHIDAVWTVADTHTRAVHELTDLPAITVPSFVDPDRYRVDPTGEVVLYVNPVKSKGVRTAISLAAVRRDVPFVFLRSWGWDDLRFEDLTRVVSALGNVEMAKSTPDPRAHYRRARVLLAPYPDLNRPRVIAEAQLSGIPALSLDEEGNREAVGPGGVLVPADAPLASWVEALGRLWDDPSSHARLAREARAYSERPEMQPDSIVSLVVSALESAAAHGSGWRPARPVPPPVASVIVPAYNAGATIDDELAALAAQQYDGEWELVVVDNESTDDTRERVKAWQQKFPVPLSIVAAKRRGAAAARNVGARVAKGEFLLFCDADDVVSPEWLRRMVAGLGRHEIVTGPPEFLRYNAPEYYEWTGDAEAPLPHIGYGHLPYAGSNNLGVRRSLLTQLGGFDEALRRTEDVDFSWRAQYAGIAIHPVPAVVHRRLRSNLRDLALVAFRGGLSEPALYARHRSHGMPRGSLQEAAESWRWRWTSALPAWRQPELRVRWVYRTANGVGRVVGSIRNRVAFLEARR